jgi:putative ABC transport system permease protein
VSVIALPADTRLLAPDIVEGRGLQPGDVDALVMNTALAAKAPEAKVGGELTLRLGPRTAAWKVVGKAREPFSPATAYVPRRYFDERGGHPGMANSLRLALDSGDPADVAAVRADLDRALEQATMRVTGSATKAETRYSFDQHMLMIYVFLVVMSVILAGVGGLGLATTMSLNVLERRREMGVLRAIGARPRTVWLIVVAEGCAASLLGWAVAAVAAWPVSQGIGALLVGLMFRSSLAFAFEPSGLVVWLAVSLALGAAASVLPAWHASRQPVRAAIAYE